MADKAKFAYGSLANLDAALQSGAVDAFDLLCLYDDGVARIGWVNKDGEPILVDVPSDDVLVVDELPETGKTGVIYIVGEIVYIWSGTQFIVISESTDISDVKDRLAAMEELVSALEQKSSELEAEVAAKIDAEEANAKYLSKMYEIAKTPTGTIVDYYDKEIRIMIPADADFTQDNGVSGAEGTFYIEHRIYAPEDAVRYRVDFGGEITEGAVEDFAGSVGECGRIYIASAPPVAYYDAESAAWVYYGVSSTTAHYIGWDQIVYWYDESGVMIGSDSIRINLSNEDCHFEIKPYYMGKMEAEIKQYTEELVEAKIEEISEIPVVEF